MEIIAAYDFKYNMKIGKSVKELVYSCMETDMVIENIELLDWKREFDTIIIGHIDKKVLDSKEQLITNILRQARDGKKNIYLFDDRNKFEVLQGYEANMYIPVIKRGYLSCGCLGKMWLINVPIVAVMGTRSKQGKYEVQLEMIDEFIQLGYKTGFLSTEPNGELVGADEVFAFGYKNHIEISEKQFVYALNQLLHKIECNGKEVIVTGSQSGTIPYDNYNSSNVTISQTAYLAGVSPDIVILTVSLEDEIEYIQRTIQHIEAYVNTKVFAVMIYPIERMIKNGYIIEKRASNEELRVFASEISDIYHGYIGVQNKAFTKQTVIKIIQYLGGSMP